MVYKEITIHTTTSASELIADILWNYTDFGVAIYDSNDVSVLVKENSKYWDYIDEDLLKRDTDVKVCASVLPENLKECLSLIDNDLAVLKNNAKGTIELGSLEIEISELENDDWYNNWKKFFTPISVGKVLICPEWIKPETNAEIVVKLNPNMAFGTGSHETTKMCLELMQEYLLKGDVVCDVGCGSGILGITALKLGAKRANMLDFDEIAVKSAKENAIINNCEDKCVIKQSDMLKENTEKCNLMLANITADILVKLALDTINHLVENGIIILSGIIEKKLSEVISVFNSFGYELIKQLNLGDWFGLALKRGA